MATEGSGVTGGGEESPEAFTGQSPWVETREGGLFFLNAVLVAPELVVLFPLTLRFLVGLVAPEREPSPFLDTIPFVASRAIPLLGWLLVIPIWTTVKNLRMTLPALPRVTLTLFLLLHLSFLAYAVLGWVG
jgi:hypothetical protein